MFDMRSRGLILVLVLMLPLRLWAAQLMPALAHATPAAAAERAHTAPTVLHASSSVQDMAPCHGHSSSDSAAHPGAMPSPADAGDDGAATHHTTCDQCQLCHGGALPAWAVLTLQTMPAPALEGAIEWTVKVIDPLPVDKPPIA